MCTRGSVGEKRVDGGRQSCWRNGVVSGARVKEKGRRGMNGMVRVRGVGGELPLRSVVFLGGASWTVRTGRTGKRGDTKRRHRTRAKVEGWKRAMRSFVVPATECKRGGSSTDAAQRRDLRLVVSSRAEYIKLCPLGSRLEGRSPVARGGGMNECCSRFGSPECKCNAQVTRPAVYFWAQPIARPGPGTHWRSYQASAANVDPELPSL